MIFITGASGAIGFKLFEHYYKKNIETIGTFNKNKPPTLAEDNIFQLDISDYSKVESFINSISNKLKDICLINGAAVTYDAFTHKGDPDKWANIIDVNLTGTYNMIRALLPIMRGQEYGRIINLSSVVAQKGSIGTSAYSASKAGLCGLTKTIAIENASKNILINNINLGYMEVGMTTRIPSELQEQIKASIPLKRFGPISDIILAIDFLIRSQYVTGTSIDINGGLY